MLRPKIAVSRSANNLRNASFNSMSKNKSKENFLYDSHRQLEVLQKIKNHFPTIKLILVSSVKTVKAVTFSLQTLRL